MKFKGWITIEDSGNLETMVTPVDGGWLVRTILSDHSGVAVNCVFLPDVKHKMNWN